MSKKVSAAHRSFLSSGAWSTLVQALGVLGSTGLSVVLARELGVTEFGVYSFIMSLVLILAIPVQFGLPTLIVRETARLLEQSDGGQIRRIWGWATMVVFAISVLVGLGLLVVTSLFDAPIAPDALLLIGFVLVPVYALGNLRAAALRGLGRVLLGQLPDVILRPGFLLLLVGAVALAGGSLDARSALILHIVAALCAFLVGAALLLRYAPLAAAPGVGDIVEPLAHRALFGSVLFLGLTFSLRAVNQQLNTILLGMLSTPAEVGHFRVALSLSLLAGAMLNVLNNVLQPRITELHTRGDLAGMQSLVTLSARVSFAASVAATFLLLAVGKPIISLLFGAEFLVAYPALLILILGQLVNSGFGPSGLLLTMCGRERETFQGLVIAIPASLVLSLMLIPAYGQIAAALSSSAGFLVWNAILYVKVRRLLSVDSSPFGLHPRRTQ